MKLTGIAASPGIGVGPILRYEREEFAVRESRIADDRVEAELGCFRDAIERSREELRRIREHIAAELGEEEARIYDTHLLILDDPELWRAVEEGVRRDRRNAAAIFRGHVAHVAAHLDRVGDETLRERRSDVVDVERRVLRHMVGVSGRALTALAGPSIVVAHELGPSEVALLDRERV